MYRTLSIAISHVSKAHHISRLYNANPTRGTLNNYLTQKPPTCIFKPAFRTFCTQPPEQEQERYEPFYYFNQIRVMRAVSRMKLYQTGLTFLALPTVGGLYSQGAAELSQVVTVSGVAIFASVMLYTMSHYFRRLIGMMAINEKGDIIRVSHLTFWGKRNDVFVPVDDVVPISDLPDRAMDVYVKFRRLSTDEYLIYSVKYGRLVKKDVFQEVFGQLR